MNDEATLRGLTPEGEEEERAFYLKLADMGVEGLTPLEVLRLARDIVDSPDGSPETLVDYGADVIRLLLERYVDVGGPDSE